MAFSYPGIGRQLYLATYASEQPSQVTYPLDPDLEDEELSDSEALNDAIQATVVINYAVTPTAATTVQYSSEPTFAAPTTPSGWSLSPSGTDTTLVLQIKNPMPGFLRIYNTSDVTIASAFVQKQVSSVY